MPNPNIQEILFPHHNKQRRRVIENDIGFAHYTNADTAYKIISNQELWLRNVSVMNDFREFEHGKECLLKLIKESEEGRSLKRAFNNIAPDVFEKVLSNFEKWAPYIKNDFYISCFSEYETQTIEEDIGKLSMWRAYGGNAGVAIIFRREFFEMLSGVGLDFSSVAYLKEGELKQEVAFLSESISTNMNIIQNLTPNELDSYLFNIFRFSALCNKHKGFEEEKEWRLIATASITPESSPIAHEIISIQGGAAKYNKN